MNAMLPGSFDPPTNGHINLIKRSSKLFDKLYVVIAENSHKKSLFSIDERKSMLNEIFNGYKNIEICTHKGLIVDFAKEKGIKILIRGVRALVDFGYEFELAMTNKQLNKELETIFIPTDPKYFVLRSSAIKELALYRVDLSSMVPDNVAKMLKEKFS